MNRTLTLCLIGMLALGTAWSKDKKTSGDSENAVAALEQTMA